MRWVDRRGWLLELELATHHRRHRAPLSAPPGESPPEMLHVLSRLCLSLRFIIINHGATR